MEDLLHDELVALREDVRDMRENILNLSSDIAAFVTQQSARVSVLEYAVKGNGVDGIAEMRRKLGVLWFSGKSAIWLVGLVSTIVLGVLAL